MYVMEKPAWVFPKTYVDYIWEFLTTGSGKIEKDVFTWSFHISVWMSPECVKCGSINGGKKNLTN